MGRILPTYGPSQSHPLATAEKGAVAVGTGLGVACRERAVHMTRLKFMWLQKFNVDSGAADQYENSEEGLVLLLKSNG